MATSRITKNFIEIFGKQYPSDGFTNVTPKVLESMNRRLLDQRDNPLYLISERIRHFFRFDTKLEDIGYKYDEFKFESPVVTTEDNFDSLLIPKDHVSRRKAETYYINSSHLFRSHTSAHQMHCLKKGSMAFISIADCYRRDEIDRSHFPVFHQCEIFKLYNSSETPSNMIYSEDNLETNFKQGVYSREASGFAEDKLKGSIQRFVRDLFDDANLETRWVDAYFPFTHPSFELEINWRGKWLEVLGCGIVRDQILKNAGIKDHIGFAAGFGLERFAMLKYEIPDIRLFWTRDGGFSNQFRNKTPFDTIKFKPFPNYPQCINDLSFWLPANISIENVSGSMFSANDFYDLCRNIGGDLIESVTLVDEFLHPKTKRLSHCYRICYRAPDRALSKEEVNAIHIQIAEACKEQFNCQIR